MTERPQYYDQERSILKDIEPDWEDPRVIEAEKENKIKGKLYNKNEMHDMIEDNLIGGAGYLSGGYLRPPMAYGGARGGIFPALIPILAGLAPMLLGAIAGDGMANPQSAKGRKIGMPNPFYHAVRPLNLTGASNFYRDIAHQAMAAGAPAVLVQKKLQRLFGGAGMYRHVMTGKVGGGVHDKLKLGHLLAPVLHGHLRHALKGSGLNADDVMSAIEDKFGDVFDKDVTIEELTKGGSILSSIWNGAKGLLGKAWEGIKGIFSNKKVQDIGKAALNKLGEVAEKRGPELTEMAANKLADYATQRMKGTEPELTKSEVKMIQDEMRSGKKKKSKRRQIEEEPEELPSGRSDSSRRKAEVERRKEKKSQELIPYRQREDEEEEEDEEDKPEKRVIGFSNGHPVYGYGMKKKKGGAWTVKLSRQ